MTCRYRIIYQLHVQYCQPTISTTAQRNDSRESKFRRFNFIDCHNNSRMNGKAKSNVTNSGTADRAGRSSPYARPIRKTPLENPSTPVGSLPSLSWCHRLISMTLNQTSPGLDHSCRAYFRHFVRVRKKLN
jgi:hypothetical protein